MPYLCKCLILKACLSNDMDCTHIPVHCLLSSSNTTLLIIDARSTDVAVFSVMVAGILLPVIYDST